jgi:hypothetical protein
MPAPAGVLGKALGYRVQWSGAGHLYRLLPHLLKYPRSRQVLQTLPSDLGWPFVKTLVDVLPDLDWLTPGDITMTVYGDGQAVLWTQVFHADVAGRQRLPRQRLPDAAFRLLSITIDGPGGWRGWPEMGVGWRAFGETPGVQRWAFAREE